VVMQEAIEIERTGKWGRHDSKALDFFILTLAVASSYDFLTVNAD